MAEEYPKLTTKEELFCLNYVKNFNATQAALNAGYSPNTAYIIGHENLRKPKISKRISQIKEEMTSKIHIEAMDILNKYIAIAFSDMGDYIDYGTEENEVVDNQGNAKTYKNSYVRLKEKALTDTTLIQEVKQGKDGISIKLCDKMKAMEKLEKYFDLLPDEFKRKMEKRKLELEERKVIIAEKQVDDLDDDIEYVVEDEENEEGN